LFLAPGLAVMGFGFGEQLLGLRSLGGCLLTMELGVTVKLGRYLARSQMLPPLKFLGWWLKEHCLLHAASIAISLRLDKSPCFP